MNTTRTGHLIPATVATAVAILALTASPALADGSGGHTVLRAELLGSMPAPASPTIAGIRPGAAPWVNGPSEARVRTDGRITVTISGLVIPPPVGTGINPIASVVATLVCGDAVQSSTAPFALSASGDGSTSDVVTVPRRCKHPDVLVQPAANRAVYIAATVEEDEDN